MNWIFVITNWIACIWVDKRNICFLFKLLLLFVSHKSKFVSREHVCTDENIVSDGWTDRVWSKSTLNPTTMHKIWNSKKFPHVYVYLYHFHVHLFICVWQSYAPGAKGSHHIIGGSDLLVHNRGNNSDLDEWLKDAAEVLLSRRPSYPSAVCPESWVCNLILWFSGWASEQTGREYWRWPL